jgi:hypothetical protein
MCYVSVGASNSLQDSMPTSNVRIRSCLERTQSIANDENRSAKPAKRPMKNARPSDKSADAIKTEAPNEDGLIAVVSKNPVSMAEGSKWISSVYVNSCKRWICSFTVVLTHPK